MGHFVPQVGSTPTSFRHAEELERLGIADENGRRVRTGVPEDMKDGAKRDFGG